MTRKVTIVAMVVLAAILIASPVLAAGSSHSMEVAKQGPKKKNWGKPTIISMTATILEIDRLNEKIYVKIQMTNKAFIQYRGAEKWVLDTSATKYFLWDGMKRYPWSFEKLGVGNKVSINARVFGEVFKARRVQVNQPRLR